VNLRGLLPVRSPQGAARCFRASLLGEETGPDLLLCLVGVAGFEPTTSSSRIRIGGLM
jgi:hypothetical protein